MSYHIIFTYHIFLLAISYFYWNILPYYCYLLLLYNPNQSAYLFLFDIPTKFMINKEKTFLRDDLCVLYVMLWNFFPMMAFCKISRVVGKKKFLLANYGKR